MQNAGDITLRQVTTHGKSFYYSCKLCFGGFCAQLVTALICASEGDTFV